MFLQNDAESCPHGLQIELIDVRPIDFDCSLVGLQDAQEAEDSRGLAAASSTHNPEFLPWF
jgi:hypothetical protein